MTDALQQSSASSSADYSHVPVLGMHLNDTWGCCVLASAANIVQQQTFYGQGTEAVVPDDAVLQAYEAVGYFNPSSGPPGSNPTDNGVQIPDGLDYLKKTGMCGHTIAGYGHVERHKVSRIRTAIREFGVVCAGVNMPSSAMIQFDNQQPFDYNPKANNSVEGGHCICLCGYSSDGFLAWTWGRTVKVTWSWWAEFGSEAWPVVSHDWVSSVSGKDPEGVDLVTLGSEFRMVTGQNPFPGSQEEPGRPGSATSEVRSRAGIILRAIGLRRK